MEFKGNILILGFNEWAIKEENKEGVTIMYIPCSPSNEIGKKGYFPIKKSYDQAMVRDLKAHDFPVLCEATFSLGSNTKGNAEINMLGFKPIKTVDIFKQ